MLSLCEKPCCLVIMMCLKKQAAAAMFEMGGEREDKTSLRNFLCSILFVDKVLLSLDPNNGFVFVLVCFPTEKTIFCVFGCWSTAWHTGMLLVFPPGCLYS